MKNDWEKFKDLTWYKYPNQQVSIDEQNYTMVLKNNTDTRFIEFSWVDRGAAFIFGKGIPKRILEIKREAHLRFNTSNVIFITNYSFLELGSYILKEFPKDVRYFRFNGSEFIENKIEELIKEAIRREEINKRVLHSSIWEDDTDHEKETMRAIIGGNGDKIGF